MSLIQGFLFQALSWTGFCKALLVVITGLVAVVAAWTARLLVRHAWFTHKLSSFSKPHADSWLIGHLGQVGHKHTHTHTKAVIYKLYSGLHVKDTERYQPLKGITKSFLKLNSGDKRILIIRCRAQKKVSSRWTSWCRPTSTPAAGSSAPSITWSDSSTLITSNLCLWHLVQ